MPQQFTPQAVRKKITNLVQSRNYQPLNTEQIATKLRLPPEYRDILPAVIEEMELEGLLARIRHDRWVHPGDAELVTGVLQVHEKGFGFLVSEHSETDIFVPAEDTATAMHQDLVVVRIQKDDRRRGRPDQGPKGRVIRILKRRRSTLVGTLQQTGRFFYVVPDDPRYVQNIYVPKPSPPYSTGDIVVVRFQEWESRHVNPEGELVERLGRPGDAGVDILAIIRKHELPQEFPSDALAELARFPHPEGDAIDTTGTKRMDFRNDLVITIDPASAKDFDDAIHVQPQKDGSWEVGIHIADVSHYVQPGSALDVEARQRGNSVYLVDQVIPMLPEELSNGLCSLNPHVDRLTVSVLARVDRHGQWSKPRITRSIIHSKHRFAYEEALAILNRSPNSPVETMTHEAWKAASALRKTRMKNGSLDLEMPEVKVKLDHQNQPVAIEKVEHDISHQLIEEFMLLANEIVATHLNRLKIPAVYRVHEPPDPEKLEAYRETLKLYDIRVGNLENRKEVQKALKKIEGRPESHALKVGLLRSMKKADYRTKCIGHYGLAKSFYTHYTSPIRRYADLIVHRALTDPKRLPAMDQLNQIAAHISGTERTASDAEMESIKLKKLQYFQREADSTNPTPFDAIIMDVQNYGLFVELPNALISGLVHVSTLDDDFYDFHEREGVLRGRRNKRTYALGETVQVVVDRIDLFKQQIDFRILSGTANPKSKRSADRSEQPRNPKSRRTRSQPQQKRRSGKSAPAAKENQQERSSNPQSKNQKRQPTQGRRRSRRSRSRNPGSK